MKSRRDFLSAASLAVGSLALSPVVARSREAASTSVASGPSSSPAGGTKPLLTRTIPSTGEQLPVIGGGTSGSYEAALGSPKYELLQETIRVFFEGGGRMFDTSPNYANADEVLGALLDEGGWRDRCFLATKIAEDSREAIEAQWAESKRRLRTDHVELLLVHNMRSFDLAWPFARELKAQGATRYIGFTHYLESGHAELERRLRAERSDFVQINYSVNAPQAARSLLTAAQDLGVAVVVNRAFDDGRLFAKVSGRPLPGWAAELDIGSWAQLFLKFAISHPAVTTVIPATSRPDRQADQLLAGTGALLDRSQQDELIALFA